VRIDVHAHYYPQEFVDAYTRLVRFPTNAVTLTPGGRMGLDERRDLLAEAGVDLQILSVGAYQPYLEREAEAVAGARFLNDLYADICAGNGGPFVAAGALPLPHVDAAIAEAGRCLDTLGMRALNTGTSIAGRPLDDPAFAPLLAELDRRGTVLILHPQGMGGGPMADAYGLDWAVGGRFEDTVTSLRLIMSGLTATPAFGSSSLTSAERCRF
jgi:aminocarboxymuconate-semialdehyde decarboxylase